MQRTGPQGIHVGLVLPFFQQGRLVLALVHIGRIPLVVFLKHQTAGVADGRVQGTDGQGTVQHLLSLPDPLFLKQFPGIAVRHGGKRALKVVVGREVSQIWQQQVDAFRFPALGRIDGGGFDGEHQVSGIGVHAAEGEGKRIFRRTEGIIQGPIIFGVHLQNGLTNGMQAGQGAILQFFFQIGIGRFLVGSGQHLAGQRIRSIRIRGIQGLEGGLGLTLLHQQGGIVHGHLVLGIRLQALPEHHHRLFRLPAFPVAYGQASHGQGFQFRVYGAAADEFQKWDGLRILALAHIIGRLGKPLAAHGQVEVVVVREQAEAHVQALLGRFVPPLAGIDVVLHHVPAGRVSLAAAHFLDIVDGVVVIPPLDRLVQQVLEGLHAVVRIVRAGIELVGIGLVFHAGALGEKLLVQRQQLGRTMLGQLAAHQGEGSHVAPGLHEDVRGFLDQGHVAGIGADGGRQVVQGIIQLTPANQDVGIGQLIVGIGGSDADNLLQGILGRLGVSALTGLLPGGFQHVEIIAVDGGVVGINLGQATQENIGFLKISQLFVQVHFP